MAAHGFPVHMIYSAPKFKKIFLDVFVFFLVIFGELWEHVRDDCCPVSLFVIDKVLAAINFFVV